MVPVALKKGMPQERRAISLALVDWVDADERQIPVGLARMIPTHVLEDGEHLRLQLCRYGSLQDRPKCLFVWMDARQVP